MLLTKRLVNRLLHWKHHLPLSPHTIQSASTRWAAHDTFTSAVHQASSRVFGHVSSPSRALAAGRFRPRNPHRHYNHSSIISVQSVHTEVHSFACSFSPFSPCIALFSVHVCALVPVGPLKGLWFPRRPLYFLHCLATITKAGTPLLPRLSTRIACLYFSKLYCNFTKWCFSIREEAALHIAV